MAETDADTPDDERAERALLARMRAGDDDAFAELVHTHGGRMLAVAKRVTRSDGDAEDVVQEAFLSAFRALDRFDGRSRLSTWLHRIVVNAALMRLRSRAARPEQPIEALLPEFEAGEHVRPPARWAPTPADEAARSERREALWQALERLPAAYREVVVLRDLEGMESKAVAEQLGVADALVRQRLHRGRQALVKLLGPAMEALSA